MYVNGMEIRIQSNLSLMEFLIHQKYELTRIAVERNREIVPKAEYEKVILDDTDVLEVVSFVGGG